MEKLFIVTQKFYTSASSPKEAAENMRADFEISRWYEVQEVDDKYKEVGAPINVDLKTGICDGVEVFFNYIDSLLLPRDVIKACSHPGPCDEDVQRCMDMPEIECQLSKINPDDLRKELREYGVWTDEDLADHQTNLERILWIAAGNIQDELHEQSKQ